MIEIDFSGVDREIKNLRDKFWLAVISFVILFWTALLFIWYEKDYTAILFIISTCAPFFYVHHLTSEMMKLYNFKEMRMFEYLIIKSDDYFEKNIKRERKDDKET